jgi:3-methyladenine DNA glycosylase Mpg
MVAYMQAAIATIYGTAHQLNIIMCAGCAHALLIRAADLQCACSIDVNFLGRVIFWQTVSGSIEQKVSLTR